MKLLAEIASGNEVAFTKLFGMYIERFYAVALKMTRSDEVAKDIVQDVFMNIWKNRERLLNVDHPSSYFFTAVYRRVYYHYRKTALERKFLRSVPAIEASENTTDEMIIAHECSEWVSEAITRLPPRQKLVFRLSKEEGMKREDIARQLKISPNTVKNHLSEALKFIHTFLRKSSLVFVVINAIWGGR
ncbi:RNA polymerase sigma-70 factor [Agriterribacter sp.]|uniref:RNA polymerase sigma-70 factor n=1 Tax=Agriterribacter sp. TaxID=2821509 RepID=UPI002BB07CA7|nr:RNA polymerase sigma-70 factor [Agriterribacter sp.]HRP57229.1 RNA polymerase sigma-70 factor [Agriterribacter sp.]